MRHPLPSPWFSRLAALVVEIIAALYAIPAVLGHRPSDVLTWVAQNTSLIPDRAAAERIGTGVETVGPYAVVLIVVVLAFHYVARPVWNFTNGLLDEASDWHSSLRGSRSLDLEKFSIKRKVLSVLRPEAMRNADQAAIRSSTKDLLVKAGAPEGVASQAVERTDLPGGPLDQISGGRRVDRFLREAASRAFENIFIAGIPRDAPLSLRIDFVEVLKARGYKVVPSGSLLPSFHLPTSPSGRVTVEAYTTGRYGGAMTMRDSLVVVGRHRDNRQEGLLLELLLAACQMYCAGMSGDRMPEAEKKFRDVTLRMASVGFVPPEDFDSPGHRGISSAEEIKEWSLDQVASVISPFRTTIDTVEVAR